MRFIWEFFDQEEAQATTEYILMLSISVALVVAVIKRLIKPYYQKLAENLTKRIDQQLFGGDMHSFRVR